MAEIDLDFAGEVRPFNLRLGEIMDIETACGGIGIGAVWLRLSTHAWSLRDVEAVLVQGLIGGGMPAKDARALVSARIGRAALADMHALAVEVMLALMDGAKGDALAKPSDPEKPMEAGDIFAAFAQMGIPPEDVRKIRHADFVLMARAMSGNSVQPPTEEEFAGMLKRYEERYGGGNGID
ncbi:gene transfer agent family protein [Rhodobacterales bacterium HKCCE4037]|nr:gene transfer agent family protein [Rhodobacterales bacterium HKCCE4037]